jgi:hypothetical protein
MKVKFEREDDSICAKYREHSHLIPIDDRIRLSEVLVNAIKSNLEEKSADFKKGIWNAWSGGSLTSQES